MPGKFLRGRKHSGNIINAASASYDHVSDAINTASSGDTVSIPAGTATWTTQLVIEKAITLQGAGIDQTTITDGSPKGAFDCQMLVWNLQTSGQHRLTGMTINGGTGAQDDYNKGVIKIGGTTSAVNLRIDHCKFIPTRTAALFIYNACGVIDHCAFNLARYNRDGTINSAGPIWPYGIYTFHNGWKGVGPSYGDNSWAQAAGWGGADWLFIEDNTFDSLDGLVQVAHDGWTGSRVVFRENVLTNCIWANHGTESAGRLRGARACEVYNNTLVANSSSFIISSLIGSRGGGSLIYNNEATVSGGAFINDFIHVDYFRRTASYAPWGQATGSNAWDQNSDGTGYMCIDQPGAGTGDLLSGDSPTPVWLNQASDPLYIWGNTLNSSPSNGVTGTDVVVVDRDLIRSAKPGYSAYTYPHPLVT